ncbi:TonB-dependent receptor [Sandaracinus amylolyticus]|uniref:TonB-dependent receptor n=1 Tax=Sandaracinus amylolyticus TaxID=927083 RepID=UPI001F3AE621|nr:TonB-dependent receptor [Sandaracinus amylolyticus]
MPLRSLVLCALASVVALASPASAQETRVPPRVLELPELVLPDGAAVSELELVVVVAIDGSAQLEGCAHDASVCDAARDVIARARFEPARVGDRVVAARTRVVLRARPPEVEAPRPDGPDEPEAEPAVEPVPSSEPLFSARARAPLPAGTRRFELAEIRDVPGAFGDPFRALEAMPGVTPVATGVPYVYVRGAPPASSLYVYDDLPLPMLFHLGIGPAVIHPRMLGPVRLHAGVAPARYGRHLGGVIVGEGPEARDVDRVAGEVELRLLDANGYVETPLLGGEIMGALRIGYPGLVLSLITDEAELFYGDYQLRGRIPLSSREELRLVWIGSFDQLVLRSDETTTTTTVQFHRGELRFVRRIGAGAELGLALRAGFEESSIGTDDPNALSLAIAATTIGPRLWLALVEGPVRLRIGADAIGSFGRSVPPANVDTFDPFRYDGVFSTSAVRSTSGAFAELIWAIDPTWSIEVGGRFDLWTAGSYATGAIDPRLRVTARVLDALELHVGGAIVRQPATFLVPLPGVADVPMLRGLQTAYQAEVGARYEHPLFEAELQLFAHRYEALAFVDFFLLAASTQEVCARPGGGCQRIDGVPRTNGTSWGGELFVRMPPSNEIPVSGWVSYTLAWNEVEEIAGIAMRPSYDVRHLLNTVVQWHVVEGFHAGVRLLVRSGAPRGVFYRDDVGATQRLERELDAYARLDVQLSYAWDAGWGRMRVSLDWLNASFSEEPIALSCTNDDTGPPTDCRQQKTPPIVGPNLGLRIEL